MSRVLGKVTGMVTREALVDLVGGGEIETVVVCFPDWYGRLLGKRMTGRFFLETTAVHGMHACDYLMACDMEMDPVPGYAFASWETGYGDVACVPDWRTLRRAAWLERTAIVICNLFGEGTGKPVEVSPRRILQRQVERARQMGFSVKAGTELELYLFRDTYDAARQKGYHGLTTWGSYIEDYHILQGTREEPVIGAAVRLLDKSGVPMESSKGEWGPGQVELNLQYGDVLEQADRNVLAKHAAKEIAHAHNAAVTFMAKPDEKLAGSGAHQHLSLWDADGKRSSFPGDGRVGSVAASDTFRHCLGGWLAHAGELTACYAPNVNSYKRYQAASFAPTSLAWSHDNRTAGFRVVGTGDSLRIECRLPGADANPYIAYAASVAAALEGIAGKLEPPEAFTGDVYAAKELPRVPRSLPDAIAAFEKSALARRAFGDEVVAHYLHFLRTEQRKFEESVTCWERARFFERG